MILAAWVLFQPVFSRIQNRLKAGLKTDFPLTAPSKKAYIILSGFRFNEQRSGPGVQYDSKNNAKETISIIPSHLRRLAGQHFSL
jgi:hypothetical protein